MLSGHFFGANLPITGALPAGSEQHRAAAEPASQVLFQPTLPWESFLRGWVSSDSFALSFFSCYLSSLLLFLAPCAPQGAPRCIHISFPCQLELLLSLFQLFYPSWSLTTFYTSPAGMAATTHRGLDSVPAGQRVLNSPPSARGHSRCWSSTQHPLHDLV